MTTFIQYLIEADSPVDLFKGKQSTTPIQSVNPLETEYRSWMKKERLIALHIKQLRNMITRIKDTVPKENTFQAGAITIIEVMIKYGMTRFDQIQSVKHQAESYAFDGDLYMSTVDQYVKTMVPVYTKLRTLLVQTVELESKMLKKLQQSYPNPVSFDNSYNTRAPHHLSKSIKIQLNDRELELRLFGGAKEHIRKYNLDKLVNHGFILVKAINDALKHYNIQPIQNIWLAQDGKFMLANDDFSAILYKDIQGLSLAGVIVIINNDVVGFRSDNLQWVINQVYEKLSP